MDISHSPRSSSVIYGQCNLLDLSSNRIVVSKSTGTTQQQAKQNEEDFQYAM